MFPLYMSASRVITSQATAAVFVIINLYVVIVEVRKRFYQQARFKSRTQKWISLLSILGGLLLPLFTALVYVDGFCHFMIKFCVIFLTDGVSVLVGFYQLIRLYHCFADKNISGGYPKWLFYIMTAFGILYVLSDIPYYMQNGIITHCGLNKQYEFEADIEYSWSESTVLMYFGVQSIAYWIWDLAILFLLIFKLRSLRFAVTSTNVEGFMVGIQQNLNRVVILTLFYDSFFVVSTAWWLYSDRDWRDEVVNFLENTVMSYAVFLMEPHNSREYGQFLNCLIRFRLHWCCCCYRQSVVDQRNHFLQRYKAVYKVSASGMELQTPMIPRDETRAETGTAFNDFSIDEPPSAKYQAPTLPLIVISPQRSNYGDSTLQIVSELAASPSPPTPSDGINNSMAPSNDFLFETESKEEFRTGFSFGVYLEYWRRNRRNSVRPKYKTLKEELTMNRHATITEEEYERLSQQCLELRKEHKFIAKDIGSMNRICGITPGSEMTLDHMITIKLYTDFTEQQRVFKRQCRRLYGDELIESVMARNREIAHWCRLLRECIMFYGESMRASDVVYCGLDHLLIFRSMNARFECPLSTTKALSVAQQFAEGGRGVILKLKRANPKTRYFNVRPFTVFKNEDERLFSGSTLKIIDILLKKKSMKRYVNALRMLEEIVNGYFISGGQQTRDLLLSLLERVVDPSVMDVMGESVKWSALRRYLDDDGYDTDALLDDVEDEMDSNIMERVGNHEDGVVLLEFIKQTHENLLDIDSIPKYVWFLFINFLDETKAMMEKGTLWVNHYDLDRREYSAIKAVLFGNNQIFDVLSIDKERISMVQQYQWMITGSAYDDLKALPIAEYITSPQFVYDVVDESDHHQITFHFRFYGRYSVEEPQCAIFLELDDIPDGVKRLRIEVDMKCYKKRDFRHLLRSRDLSTDRSTVGFITFGHEELNRNKMMQWMFGVKVLNADKVAVDKEEEYWRDLYQIFE